MSVPNDGSDLLGAFANGNTEITFHHGYILQVPGVNDVMIFALPFYFFT